MQIRTDSAVSAGTPLLKGAAVLGLAAMISKLLGVVQKIPLQNLAGDAAFGIYNAVYSFYVVLLYLATAGIPTAISVLVAEKYARGDFAGSRRIFHLSAMVMTGMGFGLFLLMYFGAEAIAAWMNHAGAARAIRSVSFALFFMPCMAAARGYFQGRHRMIPTAMSQVTEQSIRVATMILVLLYVTNIGAADDWIAAGVLFGSVTGSIAGLVVMYLYLRTDPPHPPTVAGVDEPFHSIARRIAVIALPVTIGVMTVPILGIIDTFTLPKLLRAAGLDETAAMAQFGVYHRGLPLVQLITMAAGSVSAALVPALVHSRMHGDGASVRHKMDSSMRAAWFIGLASSMGMAILALPINVMLYKDSSGTGALAILAFTGVSISVSTISAGLLQGLGRPGIPALSLLIAVIVKTALNLSLIPRWGIEGAATAAVAACAAAGLINMGALVRWAHFRPRAKTYLLKPFISLALMTAYLVSMMWAIPLILSAAGFLPASRLVHFLTVVIGVAGGALLYGIALCRTRAVAMDELSDIPGWSGRIYPALKKLRLL